MGNEVGLPRHLEQSLLTLTLGDLWLRRVGFVHVFVAAARLNRGILSGARASRWPGVVVVNVKKLFSFDSCFPLVFSGITTGERWKVALPAMPDRPSVYHYSRTMTAYIPIIDGI